MGIEQQGSSVATAIQACGVAAIALLSFFLTRSIRRTYLEYWSAGWSSLALSLAAIAAAFQLRRWQLLLEPIYLFGEYVFGLLLVAGALNYARGFRLRPRHAPWLAVPLAVALAVSWIPGSFSLRFLPQAAVFASFSAIAFFILRPLCRDREAGSGLRVMTVGLALLTLDFLHYIPVLAYASYYDVALPVAYSAYTSLYDLIIEVVVGFGIVMVVMEDVRGELERANAELRLARDRMETMARTDALTDSLNRHAFYSMAAQRRSGGEGGRGGCVVLLDLDGLKAINDSHGHAAGDAAIRAVARAIRSTVRADDLIFRWGGDEFLVLLHGLPPGEARRRFEALDPALQQVEVPGNRTSVRVRVSFGVAPFSDAQPLERAIEAADSAMYSLKQARRAAAG